MIAIQIKKIKFYYIKNIIIPHIPASLRSVSVGPFGDGAGAIVKIGEDASASGVDYEYEHHRLSHDAIPVILDI